MLRTSVMKLDPDARVARLSTKDEIEFGNALLATGSNVRRLRVDGCELEGIHYLRAFGNSEALSAEAERFERVVIDRAAATSAPRWRPRSPPPTATSARS